MRSGEAEDSLGYAIVLMYQNGGGCCYTTGHWAWPLRELADRLGDGMVVVGYLTYLATVREADPCSIVQIISPPFAKSPTARMALSICKDLLYSRIKRELEAEHQRTRVTKTLPQREKETEEAA